MQSKVRNFDIMIFIIWKFAHISLLFVQLKDFWIWDQQKLFTINDPFKSAKKSFGTLSRYFRKGWNVSFVNFWSDLVVFKRVIRLFEILCYNVSTWFSILGFVWQRYLITKITKTKVFAKTYSVSYVLKISQMPL